MSISVCFAGGGCLSDLLILRLVTGLEDKAEKPLLTFMKQKHTFVGRKNEILKNLSRKIMLGTSCIQILKIKCLS